MKMLKSRPEVVKYLAGEKFEETKLPVDQAFHGHLQHVAIGGHDL